MRRIKGDFPFSPLDFFLIFQISSKDIYSFYDQRKKAMHAVKILFLRETLSGKVCEFQVRQNLSGL